MDIRKLLVISNYDEKVTLESHFERLKDIASKTKKKILSLVRDNHKLTKLIESHNLVLSAGLQGGKLIYKLGLRPSKAEILTDISKDIGKLFMKSEFEDWQNVFSVKWDFLSIFDLYRSLIVYEYILPTLFRSKTSFVELLRAYIEPIYKWKFEKFEKKDVWVLHYSNLEPDEAFFSNKRNIEVIIGTSDQIIKYLQREEEYRIRDLMFVVMGIYSTKLLAKHIKEYRLFESQQRIYHWSRHTFGFMFEHRFREYAFLFAPILGLTVQKTYRLGEQLDYHEAGQEKLIKKFRLLRKSEGKPYEELISEFLKYSFSGDFDPLNIGEQVTNLSHTRIKDYIIDNVRAKHYFWRNLRREHKVKKILFDAKNYAHKLSNRDLSRAKEYLENPAYGNFLIIISREGIKDYSEIRDFYLIKSGFIIVLDEESVVQMITMKAQGMSPTDIIMNKCNEIIDMV